MYRGPASTHTDDKRQQRPCRLSPAHFRRSRARSEHALSLVCAWLGCAGAMDVEPIYRCEGAAADASGRGPGRGGHVLPLRLWRCGCLWAPASLVTGVVWALRWVRAAGARNPWCRYHAFGCALVRCTRKGAAARKRQCEVPADALRAPKGAHAPCVARGGCTRPRFRGCAHGGRPSMRGVGARRKGR